MTTRTVLVINSGSSSIKYQLVDPDSGASLASGLVERIGEETGAITHKHDGEKFELSEPVPDHGFGLAEVLRIFAEQGPDLDEANIVAVGHRVVQGGRYFSGPALVDDDVVLGQEPDGQGAGGVLAGPGAAPVRDGDDGAAHGLGQGVEALLGDRGVGGAFG